MSIYVPIIGETIVPEVHPDRRQGMEASMTPDEEIISDYERALKDVREGIRTCVQILVVLGIPIALFTLYGIAVCAVTR